MHSHDYNAVPSIHDRETLSIHVFFYFAGLDGSIGDLLLLPRSQFTGTPVRGVGEIFGTSDLPGSLTIDSLPEGLREIDILVNNAGHDVGGRQPFSDGDVEDWAAIIDTNVTGLIRVSHAVIPGMVARQRGHVINLGSVSGIWPAPEYNVYTASKHAVHGFSRNLRLDFAGTGIRVTEIMPGAVRTEFDSARRRGDDARADAFYDGFATVLVPDDIARCVVFALEQPPNMIVAEMIVMPTAQG